jgi:hypothetical protein
MDVIQNNLNPSIWQRLNQLRVSQVVKESHGNAIICTSASEVRNSLRQGRRKLEFWSIGKISGNQHRLCLEKDAEGLCLFLEDSIHETQQSELLEDFFTHLIELFGDRDWDVKYLHQGRYLTEKSFQDVYEKDDEESSVLDIFENYSTIFVQAILLLQ